LHIFIRTLDRRPQTSYNKGDTLETHEGVAIMFLFRRWRRRRAEQASPAEPRRRFLQLGERRYVNDAPYLLPKDLKETDRLDFQHFMLRFLLRGNFAAPLRNPGAILDVGSGTNRWAMEMARQFPHANVVGMDLVAAPTPPTDQPENFVFVQGNIFDGLAFADATFDFVHQRLLILATPAERWPDVVRELARVTRPGGWVESVESIGLVQFVDGQPPGNSPNLLRLNEWSAAACSKRGIDLSMSQRIGELMQAAGLTQVAQREIPIPLGEYGDRVGTMMEANYFAALGGLRNLVLALQVTTPEAYDAAVAAARAEIASRRCTFPYYVAYGQKR
jgi:SAM-dependent methyltransferase